MRKNVLSLMIIAALCLPAARGDQPAADSQPTADNALDVQEMMMKMAGAAGAGEKKPDSPFPDFAKVTEDMVADKGMFTLWSYKPGAKNKDSEKLLCQIPQSMLGQRFMISTSVSGGGFFTGFPLNERVVKWEMHDRQLVLVEPETRFVVNKSKEIADVVRRTHPDSILVAVPIVTKSPGGDPVIDFGRLLKSSFADIGWMNMMASFFGQSAGGGGINASLSEWTKKKVFPGNVEIGVALAVGRWSPPGSYSKTLVHYSFWKLPETGYKPRVADDRIGYFLTTNQDWSKPNDARDLFNRYINRWQLEKRDPSLAMCEPKQPIVFYIEKTVPVRFRRAVRDGILEWNKAYEKIGFLNAVEVRQQTNDNEWKDLDPEDMRYSFFRWIVAGAGFAMGPSRANPFTGQIYDADIIFDDAMVRYFEQSAGNMLPSAIAEQMMSDDALSAFFEKFPQCARKDFSWDSLNGNTEAEKFQQVRAALKAHLRQRGNGCVGQCDYHEGMKHQMAVSRTMLAGQPKEVIDRFLYDVIKEVVMHEVGHTLGLRHNFKASSVYSVEEIASRRGTGEPTCGSVMDYNPVLFFKDNTVEGHFITPTLGPYDLWAIEYGYRPFDRSYKSHAQAASDDEKAEDADEESAEEGESEDETASEVAAAAPPDFDLSQIPEEVLAQLPPEAKAALEKIKAGGAPDAPAPTGKGDGPAPAKPIAGEAAMLQDIASRSTEPLLAYATDEDTTILAPDPTVNRFDMGSCAIAWAEARMQVVNDRMTNIMDWAVKDGESWYHLRGAFQTLAFEKLNLLNYVSRYIGGQYFNRAHRGESETAPFVLVEPAQQRAAMQFIQKHFLDMSQCELPPELLNHLAPSRWGHQGSNISYTMDFPIRDMISTFQWWTLFNRYFPNTLRRIHDAELKGGPEDRLTVADYLTAMQDACWNDALNTKQLKKGKWSNHDPFISDIRRSLQREYLNVVEPLVRTSPGMLLSPDVHAMLSQSLRDLAEGLDESLGAGNADFASQAHLAACKSRIERMLNPELREYGF
jgi:hypothetical protein